MSDLRLYTFCNMYLSSIQQGIQSAHVVHEMFMKYSSSVSPTSSAEKLLHEWAENHKTIVVLNGGANQDIEDKYNLIASLLDASRPGMIRHLPFMSFHEDQYSLGGVMTAYGIVLPQMMYEAILYRKSTVQNTCECHIYNPEDYVFIEDGKITHVYREGTPDWQLINMVQSCPLAR